MKRFSLILGLIGAFAWGNAFATAPTMPTTACPKSVNFACGGGGVQPQGSLTVPGWPGVVLGYISFDSSGLAPTSYDIGNFNGTISTFAARLGTCTPGTTTALGVLDFTANGGLKFAFVLDDGGNELRNIVTANVGNVTPSHAAFGTCTAL